MTRKLSSLLLVVVLVGGGLYAAVWRGAAVLVEAAEVADWPTVTGVVVSSYASRSSNTTSTSHSWSVVVSYRYEVDGQLHHGERWTAVGPRQARNEAHADELRAQYMADDPIEVRYDPEDPSRAVIEEGGTLRGWAHVAFGLLLLGAAGYVTVTRVLRSRPGAGATT